MTNTEPLRPKTQDLRPTCPERYVYPDLINLEDHIGSMWLLTILLLTVSNIFMTFAWYGHLKYTRTALWAAIVVSWGIAFFEYCFQVPANRIGHLAGLSTAKLKTIQEVITLAVFCGFSLLYLHEADQVELPGGLCTDRRRGAVRLRALERTPL